MATVLLIGAIAAVVGGTGFMVATNPPSQAGDNSAGVVGLVVAVVGVFVLVGMYLAGGPAGFLEQF